MKQLLSGKVAVVTGASNGLGRASVERFAEEGAKVVIADLDVERGEAFAHSLGQDALFKRTDVSDADAVQALVDFTVAEFGALDVMFNNAGISHRIFPHFIDDDLSEFHKVIDVNLLGIMLGSQRAARYMKDHGGGSIINASSIGGSQAGFGIVTYRVAKAAVIHFTKCAAIDFAQYDIRVNCISPAHIETEMSAFPAHGMSPELIQRMNDEIRPLRQGGQPLKRLGRPLDIANAALFLASEMSSQVTGIELLVDGGATAGDTVNHFVKVMEARDRILREMGEAKN